MVESEDADRILVKSENIQRCMWCGTPHSSNWRVVKYGVYCSNECMLADASTKNKAGGVCFALIGVVFVILGSVIRARYEPNMILVFIFGIVLISISIFMYLQGIEGSRYYDRKGKYQRTSDLGCIYCSHINPPNVLRCQNCGASLRDSEFSEL